MADYDFLLVRSEFEREFNLCTGYLESTLGFDVPRVFTCENVNKLIPVGDYSMILSYSKKFSRKYPYIHILGGRVPLLFNERVSLSRGIRIHIGNNAEDSQGCILIGNEYSYTENLPIRCTGILNSTRAYIDWMRSLPTNKGFFTFRIVESFETSGLPF